MEGAIFGLFLRQMIMGGFHDDYNPWHGRAEKSGSAKHREVVATKKFDYLETQMKMALFENTKVVLGLGIKSNNSPLRLLSVELIDHVMSFVGGSVKGNRAKEVSRNRSGLAIIPFEGCHYRDCGSKPRGNNTEEEEEHNVGINLADLDLYTPGKKISIPLTLPNHHMTGPCYRDLRKHIISKDGWDVKRVTATPEQRREYRETRKGKSYFINAVYKVQGVEPKKKRSRKSPPEKAKSLTAEEEGGAKTALEKAVASAENDGEVDPGCLQQAINAGYSKQFVLGKAAYRWNEMKDTKPSAAKKPKTEN